MPSHARSRLDPADADSLRNRGILRHRLARRAEGYADLRASLRYDPDDVNALAELAQIYERTGLRTDARPLLERVVRLQPTNAAAWVDLSMAQVDPDEALVSVDRAIATAPGYRRAYVRRCAILACAARRGRRRAHAP
ncbi:MAG: tetratricopeptide repeat protein [Sandaracinus sp.]|nr:tetratricopeptide repeat protein [Sandaracinus sp.]